MPPHRRLNWEFYAVLRGRLAPLFEEGAAPEPVGDTLWLFPPECAHGWIGESGRACEVAVFHYSSVPVELERRARAVGHVAVVLTEDDKRQLLAHVERLEPHYRQPNGVSEFHFERALLDLCLLLLENPARLPMERLPIEAAGAGEEIPAPAMAKVVMAENWFRQHLTEQPSLADVARACSLSPAHLRRLFCSVRRRSPKAAFVRMQMEQAMQLLVHSDCKLDTVASECGFASASQFCQAFKSRHGITPNAWRRHHYVQYRHPATTTLDPRATLLHLGLIEGDVCVATAGRAAE